METLEYHKSRPAIAVPDCAQWDLLAKAEVAEAGFEALLVKLASERYLDDRDVRLLACSCQAYQSLREAFETTDRSNGGQRISVKTEAAFWNIKPSKHSPSILPACLRPIKHHDGFVDQPPNPTLRTP
jgi:phage terminase small subunit